MKLVSIDHGVGGSAGALLESGEIVVLSRAARTGSAEAWIPNSVSRILESGQEGLEIVRRLVDRVEQTGADERRHLRDLGSVCDPATRLLAPVPDPSLILAAGLAYRSHLAEMAGTPAPPHPTAFLKAAASIGRPGSSIALPADAPTAVDYEGELAVVFGSICHRAVAKDALRYVAGYTIANDISARDWVYDVWGAKGAWEARTSWEVNLMGKQFRGFTPLGPALVTADEIPDVSSLHLTTRLNGEVMQSSSVGDLLFGIEETIAFFSRWYTFRPGDVLLTGTPAGVGVGRKPPVFMRQGDAIEVEITGLGVLRNVMGPATSEFCE